MDAPPAQVDPSVAGAPDPGVLPRRVHAGYALGSLATGAFGTVPVDPVTRLLVEFVGLLQRPAW
ncbi:hypothetical protein ABZ807_01700 [Micromonospora sp. NPDC047548]|uniref:hypothetical protein n=1 Tax=Micromonospora sp. NPDC047548 TaxID=3155624 RepID=UPI0033FECEB3